MQFVPQPVSCPVHSEFMSIPCLLPWQYGSTVSGVYAEEDCVECLVELLQIYRGKGAIFSHTCTLLAILIQDPQRKQVSTPALLPDATKTLPQPMWTCHPLNLQEQISMEFDQISDGFLNFIQGNGFDSVVHKTLSLLFQPRGVHKGING